MAGGDRARDARGALAGGARPGAPRTPRRTTSTCRGEFERSKLDGPGLKRSESLLQGGAEARPGLRAGARRARTRVRHPGRRLRAVARVSPAGAEGSAPRRGGRLACWPRRACSSASNSPPQTGTSNGGLAEMNRGAGAQPRSRRTPCSWWLGFSLLSGNTTRALALADSLIQVDPLSPTRAARAGRGAALGGRWEDALQAKIAAKKDRLDGVPDRCHRRRRASGARPLRRVTRGVSRLPEDRRHAILRPADDVRHAWDGATTRFGRSGRWRSGHRDGVDRSRTSSRWRTPESATRTTR